MHIEDRFIVGIYATSKIFVFMFSSYGGPTCNINLRQSLYYLNNFSFELMSWRGQDGRRNIFGSLEVASVLFNVVYLERNARKFEDRGTSVRELKKIIFNSVYTCIATLNCLHFSSLAGFLNFCYFSPEYGGSLVCFKRTSVLCAFLMRLNYLSKKKKLS